MKQFDALRLILTTALSDREVAAVVGLSKTTVGRYRQVASTKRLSWDGVGSATPSEICALLNKPRSGGKPKPLPDLAHLHQELQRKGMTLQLLWEEHRRENPEMSLSYSHLAAQLNRYRKTLPASMRQYHVPGERAFVDYSGQRPHYIDRATQKKVEVELFVGVLGASSLIFATCTHAQSTPDFLSAHVDMLAYFGGAPEIIVSDNLKAAVVKTGQIPTIQRSYADFAQHYGIAVLPTRPYHPKDKAAVEQAVQQIQRRLLAPLRNTRFYSLEDLNVAIAAQLEVVNAKPMVKSGVSRRDQFEAWERNALRPLPPQPYMYSNWVVIPKVSQDYHVAVERHFYSVPHELVGARIDARLTAETIELFHERKCVASHPRSHVMGRHTTNPAHQPESHRAQAERTPNGMRHWAKSAGPYVLQLIEHQLNRSQPYLGLPACDSVRALAHRHGTAVLDQVAREALTLRSPTLTTLRRLLENRQAEALPPKSPRASHARGARHYAGGSPC